MSTKQDVIELLKQADAVCFDVDSTVCTGEGIDDLAFRCGKEDQVKEMTCKAMCGNLDFGESLKLRLVYKLMLLFFFFLHIHNTTLEHYSTSSSSCKKASRGTTT